MARLASHDGTMLSFHGLSAVSDKSRNLVVVPGQPSVSISVARPQPWVSVFTTPYMYVRRYMLHCIYSVLLNWVYSKAWRANKKETSLVCI